MSVFFAYDVRQSATRLCTFPVIVMDKVTEPTEGDLLRRSWECYDAETLDQYLVSGVEDPRINVQSILNRALLCDTLFPGRYTRLIEEELRFGYAMTWLLMQLERGSDKSSLLAAARGEYRDACPDFIRDTVRSLQQDECSCSDYITAALENEAEGRSLPSESLDTFQSVWRHELGNVSHSGHSLFEPACGSANDFRYLVSFGLAHFFRYTAIDIAPKNIANALRRFPDVDFRIGDLLETGVADNTFDYSFVHDLFEHLSLSAMQRAIEELLRVTRCEAWLHFFNVADMSSHQIRKVGSYHWNTLSIGRVVSLIEQSASRVEVISIAELARTKFGFGDYYNPGAYTIIATQ